LICNLGTLNRTGLTRAALVKQHHVMILAGGAIGAVKVHAKGSNGRAARPAFKMEDRRWLFGGSGGSKEREVQINLLAIGFTVIFGNGDNATLCIHLMLCRADPDIEFAWREGNTAL
jgi:hypothetical protein